LVSFGGLSFLPYGSNVSAWISFHRAAPWVLTRSCQLLAKYNKAITAK
jgi:hypothetical protein